jgi:hypothetical protein
LLVKVGVKYEKIKISMSNNYANVPIEGLMLFLLGCVVGLLVLFVITFWFGWKLSKRKHSKIRRFSEVENDGPSMRYDPETNTVTILKDGVYMVKAGAIINGETPTIFLENDAKDKS